MAIEERILEVGGAPARLLAAGPRAGGRAPLLLVHGLQGLADLWMPNLEALAAPGRRVVAPDLPVHGGTAAPRRPADLSVGGFARFLAEALDRLALARVDVVGHSLGGLLAARLALDQPARVRRLVLVSSAGLGRQVPLGTALAFMGTAVRWVVVGPGRTPPGRVLRRICYDPTSIDVRLVARLQGRWEDPLRRRALVRFAARLVLREADVTRDLHRIEAPALLVWGRHDRLIPFALGERAAARLPHARLVVLEACGHLPNLECPDLFNEIVGRFLDEADAASSG
ncbi:MAG TPA: alpha/beta fold hydrolase [Thermodesulfobacteriota bacterium]